jgi:integrase
LIRLAREVFKAELAQYEDSITLRHDLTGLDMPIMDLEVGLEEGSWDSDTIKETEQILADAGFKLEDGPGYWRAIHMIARAQLAAYRTAQAQADGDWSFVAHDPLVTAAPGEDPEPTQGLSVRDLVAHFEHDPSRANVSEKSRQQYVTPLRLLQEVVGKDVPVSSITREDLRRVRERLIEKKFATSTLNNYLSLLSSLFEWAVREQFVATNPARGLSIRDGVHKRDLKLPLTDSQLRRLFGSKQFREFRETQPVMYWGPLISIHMSLRLGEVACLLREDVELVDDVWCIHVRAGEGKSVKTRSAVRTIPVPQALIDLGFVRWATGINTPRLFEELPVNHKNPGSALGRRWARFVARLNAKEERSGGWHSLRHGFTQAAKEARLHPDVLDALAGWAGDGMRSRYGGQWDMRVIKAEIDKLRPLPEGIL